MPVRSDPQAATAKWVRNISSATADITRGVQAVTTAPGQAAAAQAQKWINNLQAAQAKWKARVASVSLTDWQNAMLNVGVPRIAQGANAKQGKFTSFMQDFLPYLQSGVATIDKMPNVTLEDSINRATAMIRHNAKFSRNGAPSRNS